MGRWGNCEKNISQNPLPARNYTYCEVYAVSKPDLIRKELESDTYEVTATYLLGWV